MCMRFHFLLNKKKSFEKFIIFSNLINLEILQRVVIPPTTSEGRTQEIDNGEGTKTVLRGQEVLKCSTYPGIFSLKFHCI